MKLNDTIDPEKTPRQLLPVFYTNNGLADDGGATDSKVKIILYKKLFFYIPNPPARKKAVLKHDVHHLLSGYQTTFKGETEISAWEIGSGCHKYWGAWLIDIQALVLGFLFNAKGVFNAFVRGKHSLNLYSDLIPDEKLKDMSISQILEIIKIPSPTLPIKANAVDVISFLWTLFIGGIYALASIVVIPFFLVYNLVIWMEQSHRQT